MKKEKKRKNKKFGFFKFVFKSMFFLFLCFIIMFIVLLWSKMKMINYEFLDVAKLGINDNLLYELEESNLDSVTAKEIKDIKNILLVGNDARENKKSGARADTIMILSINPNKKSIKLISIPRDTYVNIKGRGMDKINHAYSYGREELLLNTINTNFNLNITDYITINFRGLIELINDIGGVELDITEEERLYINERSHESYELTGNQRKEVQNSGTVVLDGEQILTHARNRTVGNDFIRQERQRKVVAETMQELKDLDLKGITSISKKCLSHVSTNINVLEYFKIIPSLVANKNEYLSNIISTQIPSLNYSSGKKINGVYYYVPDKEKSISDFAEYIFNK